MLFCFFICCSPWKSSPPATISWTFNTFPFRYASIPNCRKIYQKEVHPHLAFAATFGNETVFLTRNSQLLFAGSQGHSSHSQFLYLMPTSGAGYCSEKYWNFEAKCWFGFLSVLEAYCVEGAVVSGDEGFWVNTSTDPVFPCPIHPFSCSLLPLGTPLLKLCSSTCLLKCVRLGN